MTNSEKVEQIKDVIKLAEEWAKDQHIPEEQITRAALKDIRRIVRIESKSPFTFDDDGTCHYKIG